MRNRFEILNALESVFLSVQNKITSIRPGSVIRSLFYSLAKEAEDIYSLIQEVKDNSYIHTASGEYLDQLIYGLSKLERLPGTRAFGYVVIYPTNVLLDNPLNVYESLSNFVFSRYDIVSQTLFVPPLANKITVSTANGTNSYVFIPPLKLSQRYNNENLYSVNPLTGKQKIAEIFANQVRATLLRNPGKSIKYIVLPIISENIGKSQNLITSTINTFTQLKDIKFAVENDFDYTINSTETFSDVDGVAKIEGNVLILGEFSEIAGGQDEETDDEYRNRYWSYLNSLGKGTFSAIKEAVNSVIKNANVYIESSEYPGIIDLYMYSPTSAISPSTILLLSSVVDEVKPAGTIVNLRIPKVNYINILVDVNDFTTKNDVDRIRFFLKDQISSLGVGQKLSYDFLWSVISSLNFRGINNLFYGYYLSQEKFSLNASYLKKFLCENYYDPQSPSNLPSVCTNDSATPEEVYQAYIDSISSGKIAVYIYSLSKKSYLTNTFTETTSGNGYIINTIPAPKYPLKSIILRVLNGENFLNTALSTLIRTNCSIATADVCLRNISRYLASTNDTNTYAITIKEIESADELYANYLKIKLMTIPIPSSNDVELCESSGLVNVCSSSPYDLKLLSFLLNDVKYYQYKDLDILSSPKEVINVYPSNVLNYRFSAKYNIGIRTEDA